MIALNLCEVPFIFAPESREASVVQEDTTVSSNRSPPEPPKSVMLTGQYTIQCGRSLDDQTTIGTRYP